MQNTILTPDKVLNILIYESFRFDEIYYVEEHVKCRDMWTVNNGWNVKSIVLLVQKYFTVTKHGSYSR